MDKKVISYKRFNPNFHHARVALRDDDIRFMFLYGGSSSAKSFSIAQAIVLECIEKGYNTMTFRKTGATIADSIYKTFKEVIKILRLDNFFNTVEGQIRCFNGSYITFKGLDDPEKIKGLESYQYVFCEEISEFEESDLKQIRKRLRGRKGQKIIAAFNPISEDHWIKEKIFDKETLIEVSNHLHGKLKDNLTGKVLKKEYSEIAQKWTNSPKTIFNPRLNRYEEHKPDMVIMRSTYLNNFWVVGSPGGTYGFYDAQVIADFERDKIGDYAYYQIYALGEWGTVKTGGEFFVSFDRSRHVSSYPYDSALPVHITIDNNVLPYISVAFWQIHQGDISKVRQIHEIPAEDPFNTVSKASELTVKYLNDLNHSGKVFLYGDVSTKSGNTIDDDKLSFFDKFKDGLERSFVVEERMPKSNPSVAMTGEFINAIYSGGIKTIEIGIDQSCRTSIDDYIRVKKDVNGGILKQRIKNKETKQTYEERGHFSDTKRYFITEAFKNEYTNFSTRRKRNVIKQEEEGMKYYDPSKLDLAGTDCYIFAMPYEGDVFAMISGKIRENRIYIDRASLITEYPDIEMLKYILGNDPDTIINFEASESWFPMIRELRMDVENIRAGKEFKQKTVRVGAFSEFIKDNFYFRSDYDVFPEYVAFVESVLDYNGKEPIEAINCLAALAAYIRRNNLIAQNISE